MQARLAPALLLVAGLLASSGAPRRTGCDGPSPGHDWPTPGHDWPTHQADRARSGRSGETLDAARLRTAWVHRSPQRPRPAWPGPARWDAFAKLRGLKSMREYDPVFHCIAVADAVFYGSSADDCVYRLDAATGDVEWAFPTGGPVRVAPTWDDDRLFFGSDDGAAYCVDATTGDELWRFEPRPGERRVLFDGRLVSFWPVRTGVLVDDGVAYFAASFLPWKPSYVCAVDALTGSPTGKAGRPTYVADLGTGWTMEGALAASDRNLVVPQGRVAPLVFSRDDGTSRGTLEGGGGSFCLLTDDERVLHGPGNKDGWITDSEAGTREVVASYQRGNAIVVEGEVAYVLSDRSLAALRRGGGGVVWSVPNDAPYALAIAGDVLYCGGDGHVIARSKEDGSLLWVGGVEGRAHGLAIARGRLLASTDEGTIHAFAEGEDVVPIPPELVRAEEERKLPPAPRVSEDRTRGLVDRWVFQEDTVDRARGPEASGPPIPFVKNQVEGGLDARPLGRVDIVAAGDRHALALDGRGNDVEVVADFRAARPPKESISVEAWVRIDQPIEWGGLLSMAQDNGDFERGWVLGFRQRRFGFALAAERGDGRLTWLLAGEPYELGGWHHVVGTYDGEKQHIYVDGELAGTSAIQAGPIRYPERAYYHLGAYRDDDEYFRVTGQVHEVCLFERDLSASEVRRRFERKRSSFPDAPAPEPEVTVDVAHLASGPVLEFTGPDSAVVRWETAERSPTELVLVSPGAEPRETVVRGRRRRHEVELAGLRDRVVHGYRIRVPGSRGPRETKTYEIDTHFALHPHPPRRAVDPFEASKGDTARRLAADLVGETPASRGFAIVLGLAEGGRFPLRLAEASGFSVVAVTTDADAARRARELLLGSGLHGTRVAVHVAPDDGDLDLPPACANLVVASPGSAEATELIGRGALACVRPYGGAAYLPEGLVEEPPAFLARAETEIEGWSRLERGPLDGAGAWTHMYGSADNSAFGGEGLAGASSAEDLEVLWIGRPGPRHQSDRQNRKPAPLATNGRLFVQGLNRVTALDAFNGAILWSLELPELGRFNVPRSSGNWCADEDTLHLALGDRVARLDAATGELVQTYELEPQPTGGDYEWGYLARTGDLLLGSAVREGAHFTEFWGSERWYDAKSGDDAAKVVSESVFALDAENGRTRWTRRGGLVVNPTITVADGCIFFVESRNAEVLALGRGRIADPRLWKDLYLVALDAETGDVVWEREAKPMPGNVAFYMAHSDGHLVLLSSDAGSFALYAFDARDGESTWRKKFAWEVDHHGKHLSRPAIVGGRVYVRPLVFELDSGESVATAFPEGHQCGTYVASTDALFLRAGELCVWDVRANESSRWSRLRPDCWISTIPANGMLLSPEGGGGCSCGSWIEASIGFLPRAGVR